MLKVASLFSGCGGCDQGLIGGFDYNHTHYSHLPFKIIYALDIDQKALNTHKLNFECENVVCGNICDIPSEQIPDHDVLVGGFPCQSFSTVNPTKDPFDDRANLYKQMVRIAKDKQPKVVIAENVKGLMTLHNGSIFKRVKEAFEEAGYTLSYRLLNAANYGIPQKRERMIMVGFRKDLEITFDFPRETTANNWVPLSVAIPELAIEDQKYYFSQKAVEGMKNAKPNMKRGLWQKLDEPCLTVTSHLAKVSLNSRDPVLLVDSKTELYRRFTPREAARIQSFPDSFKFDGSESDAYRQIGNAVPPVMMWHIAKSIAELLEGNQLSEKKNKNQKIEQLDFKALFEQYPEKIVENLPKTPKTAHENLLDNNLLVSLVKNDTIDLLLSGHTNIYYTGKRFPSTVKLNRLYYFMPYRKGKGIRDLYYIQVARVGSKHEVHPEADPKDLRLVFEIKYLKQLFDDYKPIRLEIWNTFTDTTLNEIMKM